MFINLNINLGPDDPTPTQTPAEMLEALGGNPVTDTINVTVSASSNPPISEPKAGVPGGPVPTP